MRRRGWNGIGRIREGLEGGVDSRNSGLARVDERMGGERNGKEKEKEVSGGR